MKKFLGFILGVALTAGLATAAVQHIDLNVSSFLSGFTGGIIVAPASLLTTDAKINASRITRSLGASSTINFDLLAAGGCEESSAITVTGARTGDACEVGAPVLTGADAGVLQGAFTCFVSASDAVKVRFCSASATGDNPASATFYVRVTSSQ